jgi:hypothetical protein
MSDGREADTTTAERQVYSAPALTRHGSLEELTQGAGSKVGEKTSTPDTFG